MPEFIEMLPVLRTRRGRGRQAPDALDGGLDACQRFVVASAEVGVVVANNHGVSGDADVPEREPATLREEVGKSSESRNSPGIPTVLKSRLIRPPAPARARPPRHRLPPLEVEVVAPLEQPPALAPVDGKLADRRDRLEEEGRAREEQRVDEHVLAHRRRPRRPPPRAAGSRRPEVLRRALHRTGELFWYFVLSTHHGSS